MGVALADALVKHKLISTSGNGYEVTTAGQKWFTALGIDIDNEQQKRRTFARQCLDWSERRHHIAGSLGAALLKKMIADDWVRKAKNSRIIIVTGKGEKKFSEMLDIRI